MKFLFRFLLDSDGKNAFVKIRSKSGLFWEDSLEVVFPIVCKEIFAFEFFEIYCAIYRVFQTLYAYFSLPKIPFPYFTSQNLIFYPNSSSPDKNSSFYTSRFHHCLTHFHFQFRNLRKFPPANPAAENKRPYSIAFPRYFPANSDFWSPFSAQLDSQVEIKIRFLLIIY